MMPSESENAQDNQGLLLRFPASATLAGCFPRGVDRPVCFDRDELRAILSVYGRNVAAGEWRDYAIDFQKDRAVFSVFRRACETPLYRIEKDPKRAMRQGAYSVVAASGSILKRGSDLARVLGVFEKRPSLVSV